MICKLTDSQDRTTGECQWGENISHTATGKGTAMCTPAVIHYYEHELLAVFADPIYGNYGATAHLWEFKPVSKVNGDNLKSACKTGTTIRRIEIPVLTTEQRVATGILCAASVYRGAPWLIWARDWLSGIDRSARDAARDAARYAWAAARYARAAAWAAGDARDVLSTIQSVLNTPEADWATLLEAKAK